MSSNILPVAIYQLFPKHRLWRAGFASQKFYEEASHPCGWSFWGGHWKCAIESTLFVYAATHHSTGQRDSTDAAACLFHTRGLRICTAAHGDMFVQTGFLVLFRCDGTVHHLMSIVTNLIKALVLPLVIGLLFLALWVTKDSWDMAVNGDFWSYRLSLRFFMVENSWLKPGA